MTDPALLEYAMERGINYVDTARQYYDMEVVIGKIFPQKRDKLFVTTKLEPELFTVGRDRGGDHAGDRREPQAAQHGLRRRVSHPLDRRSESRGPQTDREPGDLRGVRAGEEGRKDPRVGRELARPEDGRGLHLAHREHADRHDHAGDELHDEGARAGSREGEGEGRRRGGDEEPLGRAEDRLLGVHEGRAHGPAGAPQMDARPAEHRHHFAHHEDRSRTSTSSSARRGTRTSRRTRRRRSRSTGCSSIATTAVPGATRVSPRVPNRVPIHDVLRYRLYFHNYGREKYAMGRYAALPDSRKADRSVRVVPGPATAAVRSASRSRKNSSRPTPISWRDERREDSR